MFGGKSASPEGAPLVASRFKISWLQAVSCGMYGTFNRRLFRMRTVLLSRFAVFAFARITLLMLCPLAAIAPAEAATTNLLIPAGSWWRYLDDGSNQGTAWRAPGFDDSSWPGGYAELGYGDFDEETVLGYGTNSASKYITYYFRTDFSLGGVEDYVSLTARVLRDDGVVLYLNGAEIYRNNMPAGAIGHLTPALTNVTRGGETAFLVATLPAAALLEGRNLLAAEVHQVSAGNADVSFDLELLGVSQPPLVTRGPYLQRGGTTNITVRWRTDRPSTSGIRIGTTPGIPTLLAASDAALTIEHELELTGLTPNTTYFYSVGTLGQALIGGNMTYFVTAPLTAKPTRVWVIGDAGTANINQRNVYTAYQNFANGRHTDVWLMLGDNAYGSGTDQEFQNAMFNVYPELLRQTVAWSTIGNHETYSGTFADFPFLHIFTQPVNGECGGVASGTEHYFSWDYGNIHFVCLDAMTSDRTPDGPMAQWLEADLMANTKDWTIAFWHHPPYTRGSHNSDWETELIEMRQYIVPVLEAHGVDLVLCGHSHCYERSFLLDGHYGLSTTLEEAMKLNSGDGRVDGDGPYLKPTAGPGANEGAVYVVAGSAGQTSGGALNHPAMFYSANQLGSLVLDIDGTTLTGGFLRETGVVEDHFTIVKGITALPLRVAAIQMTNDTVVLRWISRANRNYRVERTPSLVPPEWTPVATGLAGNGGAMIWSMPAAAMPERAFFRLVEYEAD